MADDGTAWTGVRNYQARNNLNLMQPGDLVLFYHSVSEKAVVGIAEVAALAAPDATAEAGSPWVAVHLRPVQPLPQPVSLAQLKADARLSRAGAVAPVAAVGAARAARRVRRDTVVGRGIRLVK